jgi:hypothetical protein
MRADRAVEEVRERVAFDDAAQLVGVIDHDRVVVGLPSTRRGQRGT